MQDQMSGQRILWPLVVLGAAAILACLGSPASAAKQELPLVVDELYYVKPGISSAELFEARGYTAQEFHYTTKDGYILRLTRGTNPLINNGKRGYDDKLPMLFVHGTSIPSTSFTLNSAGVRPKVYNTEGVDLASMTTEELAELTKGDPSVKALPFLAMNFGYEVWLLDRRGYSGSRGKVGAKKRTLSDALKALPTSLLGNFKDAGYKLREEDSNEAVGSDADVFADAPESGLVESEPKAAVSSAKGYQPKWLRMVQAFFTFTKLMRRDWSTSVTDKVQSFVETFDPEYWSFSIDEQVEFDFPQAVDVVLRESGKKKLHLVGMSGGGGIPLLSLAQSPELADKIQKAIMWAPAAKLGTDTLLARFGWIFKFLKGYVGPIPPPFLETELEAIESLLCATPQAQETFCAKAVDLIVGDSGDQAPMRLFFLTNLWRAVSILEWTQFSTFAGTGDLCKYRFNTEQENIKKYGQSEPPCYDLGQIRLPNIKFYVGNTDYLTSPAGIKDTISRIKVPTELNVINGTDIIFNHIGFFLHKQADKLVILPTLLDIERSMAAESNVNEVNVE